MSETGVFSFERTKELCGRGAKIMSPAMLLFAAACTNITTPPVTSQGATTASLSSPEIEVNKTLGQISDLLRTQEITGHNDPVCVAFRSTFTRVTYFYSRNTEPSERMTFAYRIRESGISLDITFVDLKDKITKLDFELAANDKKEMRVKAAMITKRNEWTPAFVADGISAGPEVGDYSVKFFSDGIRRIPLAPGSEAALKELLKIAGKVSADLSDECIPGRKMIHTGLKHRQPA